MTKTTPFTVSQLEAIAAQYPTPFHVYDEKAFSSHVNFI